MDIVFARAFQVFGLRQKAIPMRAKPLVSQVAIIEAFQPSQAHG